MLSPKSVPRVRLRAAHVLRPIERRVDIQVAIPHGIAAETGDILPETCEDGRSGGSRCPVIRDPRETPGWRAIPEILDRRIVVDVQSVNQFFTALTSWVCVSDIGIVDTEMVVLRVVSHLHEAADMGCPSAGEEQGYILRQFDTAILRPRYGRLGRGK